MKRNKDYFPKENDKKVVMMSVNEFINFRALAFNKHINFLCNITPSCHYMIECDNTFMQAIGY
jgi:hypothetical protein